MRYNFYTGLQFILLIVLIILLAMIDTSWELKAFMGVSVFLIVSLLMDIRGLLLDPEKAKRELGMEDKK